MKQPLPHPDAGQNPLAALNDIARIATADLELRPMLDRIARALNRHFGWEFVMFATLDREQNRLCCEAVYSERPSRLHVGYNCAPGDGIIGQVAAEGRPMVLDDVTQAPNYVETMAGARSEICVPVVHHNRLIAVLNIESTRPAAFRGELTLLQTVADQVAGAIAAARAYAELKHRAGRMELLSDLSRLVTQTEDIHDLLKQATHYLATRLDIAAVSILLLDETGRTFAIEAQSGVLELGIPGGNEWPITIGVCGRCARTGEPQLVYADSSDPDYVIGHPDIAAEFVVPIKHRDRLLGVLNLESMHRDTFTHDTQLLCRAVADQIAGAIHLSIVNNRLSETNRAVEQKTRELAEMNVKLKRANLELRRLSSYDPLTGVPNRRRLEEVLRHEWRWARRTARPLAFMLVDIDHFKALNDTDGHLRGDAALRLVAQTLADSLVRPADFIARYGGEEFALVLPDLPAEEARRYAESLRARVEALAFPHTASPLGARMTISAGAAVAFAADLAQAAELVAAADAALYEAKRAGRNCVVVRDLTRP